MELVGENISLSNHSDVYTYTHGVSALRFLDLRSWAESTMIVLYVGRQLCTVGDVVGETVGSNVGEFVLG